MCVHDSHLFNTVHNMDPSLMNFMFFWWPAICIPIMYYMLSCFGK